MAACYVFVVLLCGTENIIIYFVVYSNAMISIQSFEVFIHRMHLSNCLKSEYLWMISKVKEPFFFSEKKVLNVLDKYEIE